MVWTIDLLGGRNPETATRAQRTDTVNVGLPRDGHGRAARHADVGGRAAPANPSDATWDLVARLKKMTSMKVLLKCIETAEDARLAREQGADGIVVSNHGGRAAETLRSTIDTVPEVVDAVQPDSGPRGRRRARGTDAFKALAYGARAVESLAAKPGDWRRSARKAWSACSTS